VQQTDQKLQQGLATSLQQDRVRSLASKVLDCNEALQRACNKEPETVLHDVLQRGVPATPLCNKKISLEDVPEPVPQTAGEPARDRALADPLIRQFIEKFDVADLRQPLAKPGTLRADDLPELQARLEAQGWKVTRGGNELICVPAPGKAVSQGAVEESGVAFPTSRCRRCNGWIFWVSIQGVVACATCHPPANLGLVAHWYSVPEGQMPTTIQ
jgi:hypothetical protein